MSPGEAGSRLVRVPPGAGSGAGVRVAVVDSGVNARHSHLRGAPVAGWRAVDGPDRAVAWEPDGEDALGHGTAVAAAVRWHAPQAEIVSLKVFDRALVSRMRYVLAAIRRAVEAGVHVVNLSLGSDNPAHIPDLETAAAYAAAHGTLLVASGEAEGNPTWPAHLPAYLGVRTDPSCDDGAYSVWSEGLPVGACGYPRPLPGRPKDANFRGTSFAAGHVSGFLALLVERLGGSAGVLDALRRGDAWLPAPAVAAPPSDP